MKNEFFDKTIETIFNINYFFQGNWEGEVGGGMTAGDLGSWAALLPASRSQPNLTVAAAGCRRSHLDTSWLAQERWQQHASRPAAQRGLLTRCAVSYQNIGPAGEIFGDFLAPPGRSSLTSSDESYSGAFSTPTPEGSLGAKGGAATTNVAWLVGAKKTAGKENPPLSAVTKTMAPSGQHHIDICEGGALMAPAHLAVAPLDGDLRVSPADGHSPAVGGYEEHSPAVGGYEGQSPAVGGYEEHSPAVGGYEGHSPAVGGYMLARSHTVGNLPLWAQDLQGEESLPRTHPPQYAAVLQAEEGAAVGEPPTAATLSTRGSLRSKIGRKGDGTLTYFC
jgi:hypothetical protein